MTLTFEHGNKTYHLVNELDGYRAYRYVGTKVKGPDPVVDEIVIATDGTISKSDLKKDWKDARSEKNKKAGKGEQSVPGEGVSGTGDKIGGKTR